MGKSQEDQVQVWKTLSLVGQVGLWMVLAILLGGLAGFKLGNIVGHAQGGFIVGILAGIFLGWRYTLTKITTLLFSSTESSAEREL